MVVGAYPIAKLSVLLIKQISKPVANVCKERAKNSPFFRTYVCMPPAQFYNWCEVKAKMWILNLGKPVNVPKLSQEMAIELGANLLGESVIFIIGATLLLIEYNRQTKKESAKEAKREQEMSSLTSTITELYFTVQKQQTQLREMERLILGQSVTAPLEIPTPPPIEPPKDPKTPQGGIPQNLPSAKNINNMSSYSVNTPYPDRGIILKSLNYIQMDVISSSMFFNNNDEREYDTRRNENKKSTHVRENAVITEALHNIENNFKSLF